MCAEWSAFARPFGITHQLALPLRVGEGIEAYVVSRPDDDYDDADTDLATLVVPALAAARPPAPGAPRRVGGAGRPRPGTAA
jgi:hypothetical protein